VNGLLVFGETRIGLSGEAVLSLDGSCRLTAGRLGICVSSLATGGADKPISETTTTKERKARKLI